MSLDEITSTPVAGAAIIICRWPPTTAECEMSSVGDQQNNQSVVNETDQAGPHSIDVL